jgi:hypothetical protein
MSDNGRIAIIREFEMKWITHLTCWFSLFGLFSFGSALAESPVEDSSASRPVQITLKTSGPWKIVESPNFRCWSQLSENEARQLTESCEAWRSRLRTAWITEADRADWTPKCEVYVHTNQAAYNQTLRRPGDASVGSTSMNFDQGRTVYRRIDVRADASDWSNAALPHELTHVVLGERFGGHALPRWADEGIAMLSESAEKHRERLENFQNVLTSRTTFRINDLVTAKGMPAPHLRDAFYGQSLALSSLLVRKSTPAKFADFIEESIRIGHDQALKKHYSLNGVTALQQEWNDWVKQPQSVSFVSLPIQVGKAPAVALMLE